MARSTSRSSRRTFPVTVTQLPVVRCAECGQSLAHTPGEAANVLTRHYQATHVKATTAASDGDLPSDDAPWR